jgi:hypothetical protein
VAKAGLAGLGEYLIVFERRSKRMVEQDHRCRYKAEQIQAVVAA